jgi:hypothetical protein
MVISSEINGFGRRSFWYALPPASSPRPLSAPQVPPPRPSKRDHSSCPLLPGANRGRRRQSAALNRRIFVAGAAADRLGVPQGPGEQGESQKPPSQSLFPTPA